MEMDRGDEIKGRLDEVLQKLPSAYCQHVAKAKDESEISRSDLSVGSSQCLDIHESFNNGIVGRLPVSTMQQVNACFSESCHKFLVDNFLRDHLLP